jgi:hypothetical protein
MSKLFDDVLKRVPDVIKGPIDNQMTMRINPRRAHCHACQMIRAGVKTRIALQHTCGQ